MLSLLFEGGEVGDPQGCCVKMVSDRGVQQPTLPPLYAILVVHHQHQQQKQELAHAVLQRGQIKKIKDVRCFWRKLPLNFEMSF